MRFKRGDNMQECKHSFIGRNNGVHCTKCGLHMSAAEYAEYLNAGSTKKKPKRQTRKKVKTDE